MRSLGEIDLDERAAIIAVIRAEIAAEGSRTAFRRCLERALAKLELGPAVSPNATAARTTTKILTLGEVADRFHLKVPWLREFIRKNDIPVLRSPKLIRFDAAALGALEEALRGPSRSPGRAGGRSVRSFRGKGDSAYERLMSRRASGSLRKKRPAEKSGAGDARSRGTG
jgi:hypothetical protein